MIKFKPYIGKKKFITQFEGGEGSISFGFWHSNEVAFKKMDLEKKDFVEFAEDAIQEAKKTRQEYETTLKLSHDNIVKVFHTFRYQETRFNLQKRYLENSTIIVMERHKKNIGELTEEERIDLPLLLTDTLGNGVFILYFPFHIKCLTKCQIVFCNLISS